jgi:hypothetical protein
MEQKLNNRTRIGSSPEASTPLPQGLLNNMPIQVSHLKLHLPQEMKEECVVKAGVLRNRSRGGKYQACGVMIMTLVLSWIHRYVFCYRFGSDLVRVRTPFKPKLW